MEHTHAALGRWTLAALVAGTAYILAYSNNVTLFTTSHGGRVALGPKVRRWGRHYLLWLETIGLLAGSATLLLPWRWTNRLPADTVWAGALLLAAAVCIHESHSVSKRTLLSLRLLPLTPSLRDAGGDAASAAGGLARRPLAWPRQSHGCEWCAVQRINEMSSISTTCAAPPSACCAPPPWALRANGTPFFFPRAAAMAKQSQRPRVHRQHQRHPGPLCR